MRRDMDLARRILLTLEERDDPVGTICAVEIEGVDPEVISYHVMLLDEAGLVKAQEFNVWIPLSLTWSGHEFLDASRNETHWKKAKSIISEKGGALVFEVLKELLVKLAKEAVL